MRELGYHGVQSWFAAKQFALVSSRASACGISTGSFVARAAVILATHRACRLGTRGPVNP
jgi:hypothetical protein